MAETVIRMKGITKRFPGVLANDCVDLEIQSGKIHALLGENGAGKTTLMNILSGRYHPDEGQLLIGGKPEKFRSPREALQAGIGMVHQHFMLVSNQTVAENMILGLSRPRFLLHRRKIEQEVETLSETYGLSIDPRAIIAELSLGQQQRVEILKLLYRHVDILILDEPTAVLTPSEIDDLFTTLRSIVKEGRAVIFITHKLEEVMEVADQITVLRRGRVIAHLTPESVESRKELARLMVGREVVLKVEKEPIPASEVVLEVRNASGFDERGHLSFQQITFSLRKGEILALVGVAGNGQSEMIEAIMGWRPTKTGEVLVFGRPLSRGSLQSRNEIGYIPEDRLGVGSIANLDLVDNLALTIYPRFCKRGFFQKDLIRKESKILISKFHITAPDVDTRAKQLSGGNLQKLILAREISKGPKLLIAEQPTHGLDIGATEEVWKELLRQRASAGILLVTGDLREALSLGDKIGVMFRGRLMDIFSVEDEEKVGEIGPMMAGMEREQGR
jgi:simple sugar transport system ATP-binding protein